MTSLCHTDSPFSGHQPTQPNPQPIKGIKIGKFHQLFALSGVNGNYRVLLAVRCQSLHGHATLKSRHGTLDPFEHLGDRIPREKELVAVGHQEEESWGTSNDTETEEDCEAPRSCDAFIGFSSMMMCFYWVHYLLPTTAFKS